MMITLYDPNTLNLQEARAELFRIRQILDHVSRKLYDRDHWVSHLAKNMEYMTPDQIKEEIGIAAEQVFDNAMRQTAAGKCMI